MTGSGPSGREWVTLAFQFDLESVAFLRTDTGRDALDCASALPLLPATRLKDLSILRSNLTPEQAGAVLEQAILRRQAAGKFRRAGAMLFTADALQQATHEAVAAHRARRLSGRGRAADLGCSIGGDALALAPVVGQLLALDLDPVRLAMARHNLSVGGAPAHVLQADLLRPPFSVSSLDAVFCDPARRTAAGRVFAADRYVPSLEAVRDVYAGRPLAMKVGPGLDFDALGWEGEVELVSLRGEVKEATLWGGALATPGVGRRATLLPEEASLTDLDPADGCPVGPVSAYLYEPDGAVVRAGLVQHAGTRLGLHRVDPHIAYLSGDAPVDSPFVRGFRVEEGLPFQLKRLVARLRALDVGVVELKKRGVALNLDTLRPRLKLRGSASRTVIFTRIGEQPWAFICTPL